MKKTFVLALVLVALLIVGIVPALAAEHDDPPKLVPLTVINKTGAPVYLQLNGTNAYFLTIPADSTSRFTVEKEEFVRQTWACGAYAQGTLDMVGQVKLNFTACGLDAPNSGEATQEKVSLFDSPTSVRYRYQDFE